MFLEERKTVAFRMDKVNSMTGNSQSMLTGFVESRTACNLPQEEVCMRVFHQIRYEKEHGTEKRLLRILLRRNVKGSV